VTFQQIDDLSCTCPLAHMSITDRQTGRQTEVGVLWDFTQKRPILVTSCLVFDGQRVHETLAIVVQGPLVSLEAQGMSTPRSSIVAKTTSSGRNLRQKCQHPPNSAPEPKALASSGQASLLPNESTAVVPPALVCDLKKD